MSYDEEHSWVGRGPTTGTKAATFFCFTPRLLCLLVHMGQTASTPAPPPSAPAAQPTPASSPTPAQCPVQHDGAPLNARNQMPDLPQHAIYQNQAVSLSTERITSSIPRDASSNWDYPSPQQFYNALVRKGWGTPEEHIDTMVEIHNFLNEQAWNEVLKWESRHGESVLQLSCLLLYAYVRTLVRMACY